MDTDPALLLAQAEGFSELQQDPALTVASVLLIVVSLAWIVVSRRITVNMRKAAYRRLRAQGRKIPAGKDLWSSPP